MKIQIHLNKIEFLKPYRYFIYVKVAKQAKRTEISTFTQTPKFVTNVLQFSQCDNIIISACIVLDYTGKIEKTGQTLIFGKVNILKQQYEKKIKSGEIFIANKEFIQEKVDKKFVIGHFQIIITQSSEISLPISDYIDNPNDFKFSDQKSNQYIQQSFWKLNINIHAGVDFPPNSGYFIQVGWTQNFNSAYPKYVQSSKLIEHQMNPLWRQYYVISTGLKKRYGFLNIILKDKFNSIIETIKFDIQRMVVFMHYHFQVVISQDILGFLPKLYISFVVEDLPQKSLIQQICKFKIMNIQIDPQPQMNSKFFMVFSTEKIDKIIFKKIKILKGSSVETKGLQQWKKESIQFFLSPLLQVPFVNQLSKQQSLFYYPILKSHFLKNIYCYLFELPKHKKFTNTYQDIMATYDQCVSILKPCFYQQQKQYFIMKWQQKGVKKYGKPRCIIEIMSSSSPKSDDISEVNLVQTISQINPLIKQWKGISNQLYLKQKLIYKMQTEIQQKTNNIHHKGPIITSLRKAQQELQDRHKYLQSKVAKMKSIQIYEYEIQQKINIKQLEYQIINNLEELETKYNANQEMKIRLESLDFDQPNLNISVLEKNAVQNSRQLQQMQQKIEKIPFYKQIIKKQNDWIMKLQKLFQKRQIDKQMNELLNRELKKLEQIKYMKKNKGSQKKLNLQEYRLKKIYDHIQKQKQEKGFKSNVTELKRKIENAEDQLKKKTEYYTKLLLQKNY